MKTVELLKRKQHYGINIGKLIQLNELCFVLGRYIGNLGSALVVVDSNENSLLEIFKIHCQLCLILS